MENRGDNRQNKGAGKMIIGKLDADGLKIKEVDVPEREPIFCEVCGKEVRGKSIGERTEYPIHEMTRFIFCSECQKKIRQDITDDLLEYERQKVIEWVRKKQGAGKRKASRTFLILKKVWKNIPYLFLFFTNIFCKKCIKYRVMDILIM